MAIVAKFSTLAGGCFIEQLPAVTEEYSGRERCFRFDSAGRCEYAILADLNSGNPAPRWFGHQYTEKDFVFC